MDPLAHSAVNPIIRLAALRTTSNVYILRWHANYPLTTVFPTEEERATVPQAISPFYIPEDEEIMEMYREAAQEKIIYLTRRFPI